MSLALYRTYRPGRFADVVGQEHVTGPLMRALEADRVHHAYLFSGPRGCGKTTSARILARSLNCEQGPTPEPCGQCRSCVDLAPNGPGSMDVIELDAATHGLVDDARDLREKAHFSPVSSAYKVYIIDEAHQLGPGAANALLKIIEEPPSHLKFVFATTAPDKLLGTIRSRTHHYPFRLVPSRTLQQHLARIAELEGVPVEPAALSLVARAGAGSVRDALSVLGQLIAGSGPEGVTAELANALLGFTPAALLDEVVDAITASDGATVFAALDRVLETGHDPRRFLTDLMERFRDLLVLQAVPDAADQGLLEAADDEVAAMAAQAGRLGPHDLVRLADVVDAGITAMKGATPTRLQLELVCARLLLPGADDSVAGVSARLDRMERRLSIPTGSGTASSTGGSEAGDAPAGAAEPPPRGGAGADAAATATGEGTSAVAERAFGAGSDDVESGRSTADDVGSAAVGATAGAEAGAVVGAVVGAAAGAAAAEGVLDDGSAVEEGTGSAAAGTPRVADLRRQWPDILELLKERKKFTWILLSQHAQVVGFDGDRLQLGFDAPGPRSNFTTSGHDELVRQAIIDRLGLDLRVEAVVDPGSASRSSAPASGVGGGAGAGSAGVAAAAAPAAADQSAAAADQGTSVAADQAANGAENGQAASGAGAASSGDPASGGGIRSGRGRAAAAEAAEVQVPTGDPVARDAARAGARGGAGRGSAGRDSAGRDSAGRDGAGRDTAGRGAAGRTGSARAGAADVSGDPRPDDDDLDDASLSHRELLERTLGAKVISELEHDR